jgi:hypothetical protein
MLRGPHLIRWETLIGIVLLFDIGILPETYLKQFELSKPIERIYGIRYKYAFYRLYDLWRKRRMKHAGSERYINYRLIHNLKIYYELECRDPRDRIYALLAISGDARDLNIRPNYSDSTTPDLLAIQLTTSLFKRKDYQPHCLEMLLSACYWRQFSTLPS